MSAPDAPSRGELDIVATLTGAFQVIRRQWLALVVLALMFEAAPRLVFWRLHLAFPPGAGLTPTPARAAETAVHFIAFALFSAAAARVALADRLTGASLNPRQALALAPDRLGGLFAALLIISILPLAIELFNINRLPSLGWFAGGLIGVLVFGVLAGLFSATVPVTLLEGAGGPRAVARALALTRGHRPALIGACILLGAAAAIGQALIVGLATFVIANLGTWLADAPDSDMASALISLAWTTLGIAADVLFVAWAPVLYLALRKAKEGLGEDEAEMFS